MVLWKQSFWSLLRLSLNWYLTIGNSWIDSSLLLFCCEVLMKSVSLNCSVMMMCSYFYLIVLYRQWCFQDLEQNSLYCFLNLDLRPLMLLVGQMLTLIGHRNALIHMEVWFGCRGLLVPFAVQWLVHLQLDSGKWDGVLTLSMIIMIRIYSWWSHLIWLSSALKDLDATSTWSAPTQSATYHTYLISKHMLIQDFESSNSHYKWGPFVASLEEGHSRLIFSAFLFWSRSLL